MRNLKKIISEEEIARRVNTLAEAIQRDYEGGELLIICVLSGSIVFLADLIRKLDLSLRLDMISVSSYRDKSRKPSRLKFLKMFSEDVRGKHVLVIDDICDTGATLKEILRRIDRMSPASVKSCVFLNKTIRRACELEPDYIGFDVGEGFVVGYGLDFDGRFRNLPYVAEVIEE